MRLTGRQLLLPLVLLIALGIFLGVAIAATQENKPKAPCTPSAHKHRYADLKLALVEVGEHDACGFRFNDLERPVSGRVQLAEDFAVAEIIEAGSAGDQRSVVVPRSTLRAGLRGVMAYCEVCRTVLTLKTWRNEK